MYRKSATAALFAGRGLARREIFPHDIIVIQKPYPDALLLLERRGMQREELERGRFFQLNLYTTDFYGLPEELFSDPEINWHRQQFGQKGLIAAAGLWIRNSVATTSGLQSDLCQQLYRHSTLKFACKARVQTHFRYWYAYLFNAVLDFCIDLGISTVLCPTGDQVVANTRKSINPELFRRIYDYPRKEFCCRDISVGRTQYLEIPIEVNRGRVVRLAAANLGGSRHPAGARICIFHDIEEDVDTQVSPAECADNLARMLEIERSFGVDATYNVLGTLLGDKKDEIRASNPDHSIGFHSFNHDPGDLAQLSKCRLVDLRVRGYRPPQSRMTPELTDYNLTRLNFEWLACGAGGPRNLGCRLENGVVKIPIHLDDYSLFLGNPYEQWEREVLASALALPFFGLSLHDCYGEKWLGRYRGLLDKLATIKQLVNADVLCDGMFLAESIPLPS
jgi:hypothetical protein